LNDRSVMGQGSSTGLGNRNRSRRPSRLQPAFPPGRPAIHGRGPSVPPACSEIGCPRVALVGVARRRSRRTRCTGQHPEHVRGQVVNRCWTGLPATKRTLHAAPLVSGWRDGLDAFRWRRPISAPIPLSHARICSPPPAQLPELPIALWATTHAMKTSVRSVAATRLFSQQCGLQAASGKPRRPQERPEDRAPAIARGRSPCCEQYPHRHPPQALVRCCTRPLAMWKSSHQAEAATQWVYEKARRRDRLPAQQEVDTGCPRASGERPVVLRRPISAQPPRLCA
jgi:hypothetical protein